MSDREVSEETRRFIQSTINSVDELEVLVYLMSNADRNWSVEELSARMRMALDNVARTLNELSAVKLLEVREGPAKAYRYAPSTTALAAEVAENLDKAYRERRDALIQLIYSRPMNNIRIFADSFRIRRGDK